MAIRLTFGKYISLAALLFAGCATLCAQSDSDASARLMSFTGQVSVIHDSSLWALNVGDKIRPKQVIVTGPEGYAVFKVADGSTFEVFPKSKVVFRANQGDWTDLLEVWLGKIRLQVEHLGGTPNRNKVRTPTAVISVRGTIFDVEVDDDETTHVLDEEGSVSVRHIALTGKEKELTAGEYVTVYKNEPLAQKGIDKGNLLRRAAQMASDALSQLAMNASRVATGSGSPTGSIAPGTTTTGAGDGDKTPAPATPPPTTTTPVTPSAPSVPVTPPAPPH